MIESGIAHLHESVKIAEGCRYGIDTRAPYARQKETGLIREIMESLSQLSRHVSVKSRFHSRRVPRRFEMHAFIFLLCSAHSAFFFILRPENACSPGAMSMIPVGPADIIKGIEIACWIWEHCFNEAYRAGE